MSAESCGVVLHQRETDTDVMERVCLASKGGVGGVSGSGRPSRVQENESAKRWWVLNGG